MKIKILGAIFCVLWYATIADAVFDTTGWNWQRPISIHHSSEFVLLSIPPEVFNDSQPSLNDLRVLDENNTLVPHIIQWGRIHEIPQREWQSVKLINATFTPGKYSRITIDFDETVEKNLIQVSLSGKNYRRRALLEGSNDGKGWEIISEDLWLFDISTKDQNFKVDILKFPTNYFRYLRLTVYNMSDDPRHITIEAVKGAFQQIEVEKELIPVSVKQIGSSHSEDKKQSILEFDLGFRNLPVVNLQLEVVTPYFYRGYELYGRNELKEKVLRKTELRSNVIESETPWRFLHRGVFYRIQQKNKNTESLKAEDLNAPYRYLKLLIFNGDNPPLQIQGISMHHRKTNLVLQAQANKKYLLLGGNLKVSGADYDLAKAVQGLEVTKLPVVNLGPKTGVPQKEQLPPWTERYSVIILIVLIIAVAFMVLFILKNLKKLPPTEIKN